MSGAPDKISVRNTQPADFQNVIELCRQVYPGSPPWAMQQLESHWKIFPEGQFVAVEAPLQKIVGMAASLIVLWDDYDMHMSWRDFTDHGMFTNHDPERGRTLYGAEVMVHPALQGTGVGTKMYAARRELVQRSKLLRIRAGARLRGYHRYANRMSNEEYVIRVVNGELSDPTLSFQIKRGFTVIAVVNNYLPHDRESLGNAAVIEWINRKVATPADVEAQDPKYRRRPDAGTRQKG